MVLGASPNRQRFSNTCVKSLIRYGYEVVPLGIKEGKIAGQDILRDKPAVKDIHTVTLYLNQRNQEVYEDYILQLRPQRIIFNPGAENQQLKEKAMKRDIEVVEDCTLIMLNSGTF
jgi:predicted CoA-binding protein